MSAWCNKGNDVNKDITNFKDIVEYQEASAFIPEDDNDYSDNNSQTFPSESTVDNSETPEFTDDLKLAQLLQVHTYIALCVIVFIMFIFVYGNVIVLLSVSVLDAFTVIMTSSTIAKFIKNGHSLPNLSAN